MTEAVGGGTVDPKVTFIAYTRDEIWEPTSLIHSHVRYYLSVVSEPLNHFITMVLYRLLLDA